jgi:hypothetical protein
MAKEKFELIKSIEAQKLNLRTGIPTTEPPVSIPFGGIIEDVVQDRDVDKFVFLGQRYQCAHDIVKAAIVPVGAPDPLPAAAGPKPAVPAEAPALVWQQLKSSQPCSRAKVPGGWLVSAGGGTAFYPDAEHAWDGTSLP